ncbi:MAG: hypothetical protein JRN33_02525 [Nitrososphaerota archaeon]|jgi:hypothetical protein|nr:hypothetical protein [Nitrososphaerota archaeon]
MGEKELLRSTAQSLQRISRSKSEVASGLDSSAISRQVERVTKPGSPGAAMKKAGVALIAAPEPLTGVAGVALVASSFAIKGKEPASLASIAQETRKILREIQSFRI